MINLFSKGIVVFCELQSDAFARLQMSKVGWKMIWFWALRAQNHIIYNWIFLFIIVYPNANVWKCKFWLRNASDFFLNRFIFKLADESFFKRNSCLLRASEWCFRKTPNVQSWLKNDMILGATRPKSYHLQLKFPFNYCISRCRCPNNANVGSKIQGISFFVNKSICRLDDRSFFNRHSCLLRAFVKISCQPPHPRSPVAPSLPIRAWSQNPQG